MFWAKPRALTVSPMRLRAGRNVVATLERAECGDGALFYSCADIHIQTKGVSGLATLLDGAEVRLYAIADEFPSLIASAIVGAATLETIGTGARMIRRGLIAGARNVACKQWQAVIVCESAIADAGKLTLTGWGCS